MSVFVNNLLQQSSWVF